MRHGRPCQRVELTDADRSALETLVRKRKAGQWDVLRAEIALRAARGESTQVIAQALGITKKTVCKWRGRAARHGREGLKELPRSGRPRRITDVQRLQLVALACEPAEEGGRTTPTLEELVDRAQDRGIVNPISQRHMKRILDAGDLHPHRVRQWIHSPDPQFREKANEICELYRKPLPGSVVLSIDEKTGIQAIERIGLGRPPAPGRIRREEFEYVRHGTQTLIAALDVHSGTTLCSCGASRTQKDLDAFMRQVARAFPWRIVHVIWDNLNTHQAERWAAFNRRHKGRFRFHFTPLHASWVNQIELLFSSLARRCLRHASHTSTAHLKERIERFFQERNAHPRPFKWSFKGFHLQTGEPKRQPGRRAHVRPLRSGRCCRSPAAPAQAAGA
jgi:transposase